MSKHTPGPWSYDLDLVDKSTDVEGPGKYINEPVCTIPHDDITEKGFEEVKANARLIAAAPDLLEALRFYGAISPSAYSIETKELLEDRGRRARAAIAKATGGKA